MASTADADANMKYLLLVIKHADFKPNYRAVATEAGINNANNAQKRFKKLVENGGFALVKGAVISPGSEDEAAPVTPKTPKTKVAPVTPKKPKAKNAATPAKKRKLQEVEEEDGEAENGSESEGEQLSSARSEQGG